MKSLRPIIFFKSEHTSKFFPVLLFLLLLCFQSAIYSQPFTMHLIGDKLEGAGRFQVADINGDDTLDVVVHAFRENAIVWFQGPDWVERTISGSWLGGGIDTADMDGDNDLDIIATSWQTDYVAWFENPEWVRHNIDLNLDAASGVCAADMNGDKSIDVVVAGGYTNELVWYEAPSWEKHVIDTMVYTGINTGYVDNVSVIDIDNDGDLDVIATAAIDEGYNYGSIIFYEGPDWNREIIDETTSWIPDMDFADLDGDDTLEIFTSGFVSDLVSWYDLPGGNWHTIASINYALGVAAADIDMDGNIDVVVAGQGTTTPLRLYKGPTWTLQVLFNTHPTFINAYEVSINDMDGDGDQDIVATISEQDSVVWFENYLIPPTAINDNTKNISDEYTLNQNYPNPFNPITTIEYQLLKTSEVELSIYNLLGQKVTSLVSEKQPVGFYKVEWDARVFASGVYLYRLETDNGFTQTKKLILMK